MDFQTNATNNSEAQAAPRNNQSKINSAIRSAFYSILLLGNFLGKRRADGLSIETRSEFSWQIAQDENGKFRLPRSIFPGSWSDIGVYLPDSSRKQHSVDISLPEGWSLSPDEMQGPEAKSPKGSWYVLTDEKGRKRASICTGSFPGDNQAHVYIYNRFGISKEVEESPDEHQEVGFTWVAYDGTEVLFRSSRSTLDETSSSSQRSPQEAEARGWLSQHYPSWESHLAYWN